MQLTLLFLYAALAGAAWAVPSRSISKRDLATIQKAIGDVQTALMSLDTSVKALSTDPNTAAPVLTGSQNVQRVIENATTTIQGTAALSLTDALSLQDTAKALTAAVNTTVGDLAGKKAALDGLGVTQVAVQALRQQGNASAALGNAIVSKVPALGQGVAKQSIDTINMSINGAIMALSAPAGGNTTVGAGSNSTAGTRMGNGAGTGGKTNSTKGSGTGSSGSESGSSSTGKGKGKGKGKGSGKGSATQAARRSVILLAL